MHEPVSHLLFISPDANKSNPIAIYLENEGYQITLVKDGKIGLKMVRAGRFDLILINILLPNIDGFEVLKQIRQSHLIPVILLSDKDEEFERVYGLELGADDYVARPLSYRELLARIRARLRREQYATSQSLQPFISAGRLCLDTSARTLALDHKLVNLTDAEFGIAEILIMNKGQVVSKQEISRFVFKRPLLDYDRSIDMHLSNLRKKLAQFDGNDLLRTIRGNGYMLVQKWA